MKVNAVTNADGTVVSTQADQSTAQEADFSGYMDKANNYQEYLEGIFKKASDTYQVSKDLLKAMAKAESGFRADVTSRSGAMGIMQLMPETAKSLGVTDAYDPVQSIMGGAKLIASLLEKYKGNVSYAVAAYNAGSGNVDKYGGIPPFTETQRYVAKVMQYLNEGTVVPQSAGSSLANVASKTNTIADTAASEKNSLQDIMDKYFDYDDYLAFLQLFTKIISEKINGTVTDPDKVSSGGDASEQNEADGRTSGAAEQKPAQQLTMKVRDTSGNISVYGQMDGMAGENAQTGISGDAYSAYQYMTSGGNLHIAVRLTPNETV